MQNFQSLKALRSSDLLPYVVFVSPPALQQLKRQKEKQGQHNVRDEELKAILQDGKRIEQQYGHYFDKLIINVDLDRSFNELKETVHRLETEPQWVPSAWLAANNSLARS
jgi:MAGUK p55 subfamily protein 5